MKKRLLLGALGGALGGLVMKVAVEVIDPKSFGLSTGTDAKTAHEIWRRLSWSTLPEQRAARIGAAMHYIFAAAAGATYAGVAERYPGVQAGHGAAFGALLWLVGDELAVSAAGLEDPWATPAFSHLSALGAHVLFGLVINFSSKK